MQLHISEIASLLSGHIIGEGEVVITHPCTIDQGSPGGVTFLANPKYNQYLTTTQASLVLIGRGYTPPANLTTTLLVVDDPYLSFGRLLAKFHSVRHKEKTTIEFPSYIGQQVTIGKKIYRGAFSYIGDYAKLGDHVKIYPQTYIGDYVTIGNNTIIYSGAKIYPHTTIGNNCIIHAGAVIGSDGFSFAPSPDGIYEKIPSLGHVMIEDSVEIGANTTIDSGMITPTHIQQGVKIDNLVQIAHNVQVGAHSALAAQVGIAGSAKMGTHCKIGGQVGINGHITLGNHTTALGRAGITKSFPQKGNILSGTPAFDSKKFLTAYAHFKNLPQLAKKVENLSILHLNEDVVF